MIDASCRTAGRRVLFTSDAHPVCEGAIRQVYGEELTAMPTGRPARRMAPQQVPSPALTCATENVRVLEGPEAAGVYILFHDAKLYLMLAGEDVGGLGRGRPGANEVSGDGSGRADHVRTTRESIAMPAVHSDTTRSSREGSSDPSSTGWWSPDR